MSWTVVDADPKLAKNYTNLVVDLRGQVSHPYRDNTSMMNGGQGESYLSMIPLTTDPTSVELIISHRDLYVLGYRVTRGGQRIVYVFKDTNKNDINKSDYNSSETLSFGGGYPSLVPAAGLKMRQQLVVTPKTLRDGIKVLEQEPRNNREQQAKILLALVMIVSEGARFTDVYNTVSNSLGRSDNDALWRATDRQAGIMNSWGALSQFIVDNVQDTAGTSTKYFPKFEETLTLREALDLCAVIKRPRT